MRSGFAGVAVLLAVGGTVPACALAALLGAAYVARSPDRLLDAAYVAAFCGVGYLVG